jgi:hypothetical protein
MGLPGSALPGKPQVGALSRALTNAGGTGRTGRGAAEPTDGPRPESSGPGGLGGGLQGLRRWESSINDLSGIILPFEVAICSLIDAHPRPKSTSSHNRSSKDRSPTWPFVSRRL